jgi:hypothetical protein
MRIRFSGPEEVAKSVPDRIVAIMEAPKAIFGRPLTRYRSASQYNGFASQGTKTRNPPTKGDVNGEKRPIRKAS